MTKKLLVLSIILTFGASAFWDLRINIILSSGKSVAFIELILRHCSVIMIGMLQLFFSIGLMQKLRVSAIYKSRSPQFNNSDVILLILFAFGIMIMGLYGFFHAFILKDNLTILADL